jgi:hypothetical protein
MKKISFVLLLLAVMGGFAMAQGLEALEGLSVGGEIWSAPGKDDYDDDTLGTAPFAEYEKSIDVLDVYLKGEYLINLDDDTNQALYLEEAVTFNAGKAGPGELSVTLNNYNLFGTSIDDEKERASFYPPDDAIYVNDGSVKRVTGVVEPSVSYALEALPLTFTVGLPIGYTPSGSDYESQFIDLYGTVGFEHESGFGLEATGNFNISHEWADGEDETRENFYEIDVVLSYKYKELASASFEVDFPKDWDGKFGNDYVFIPGVEVYVDKLTIYGAVEIDYYKDKDESEQDKNTQVGFLAGIKYSF